MCSTGNHILDLIRMQRGKGMSFSIGEYLEKKTYIIGVTRAIDVSVMSVTGKNGNHTPSVTNRNRERGSCDELTVFRTQHER